MTFQEELILLLKSRYPILYVSTIEEDRLEYTIRKSCDGNLTRNIYVWDFIEGYKNNPNINGIGKRNPLQALEEIEKIGPQIASIFILKDFRRFLSEITISRKLRNLIKNLKTQPKTIIIVDSEVSIPAELREYITVVEFSLPSLPEIREEVFRLGSSLNLKREFKKTFLNNIVQSSQGLSLDRIRRVLAKSIILHKTIDARCLKLIGEEKKQIINQTQMLEFCDSKASLKDVGGVLNLKRWLYKRTNAFSESAINYGLPVPRGILLIGMQGSGKSLIAKGLANDWQLPLLRLDVGRLFGGIVGESESRVREMISITETLSPCILWIDEIDKAFYDSERNSDSGTSSRVLGTFITWLAEKTSSVFVVATANNIYSLPIEILRKGRFDEIFFIGLPTLNERRMIFQVQLSKFRPESWSKFNIRRLSRETNDFSGAEIRQAIIEAMHNAFNEKREFTTEDISKAISDIIPLAQIDPERTDIVQEWAYSGRIRVA